VNVTEKNNSNISPYILALDTLIVLSVLQFTDQYCPFGIFKLFLQTRRYEHELPGICRDMIQGIMFLCCHTLMLYLFMLPLFVLFILI